MTTDVRIAFVLSRYLAATSEVAGLSEISTLIRQNLDAVWQFLRREGVSSTGHNVVVYPYQPGASEPTFNLTFGVELQEVAPFSPSVKPFSTPSGYAAIATYRGPYTGLPQVNTDVRNWCSEQGIPIGGTSWEVYGDWDEDPEKLRTDVIYQLAPGWRPEAEQS